MFIKIAALESAEVWHLLRNTLVCATSTLHEPARANPLSGCTSCLSLAGLLNMIRNTWHFAIGRTVGYGLTWPLMMHGSAVVEDQSYLASTSCIQKSL
jgi:hypothetical protein